MEQIPSFTDIPVVGLTYNVGMMVPSWDLTAGSWLGETGYAATAYSGSEVNRYEESPQSELSK